MYTFISIAILSLSLLFAIVSTRFLSRFIKNKSTLGIIPTIMFTVSLLILANLTQLYIMPYYHVYKYESDARKTFPLFVALESKNPKKYEEFKAKLSVFAKKNALKDAVDYARSFMAAELSHAIALAENDAIYNFIKAYKNYSAANYKRSFETEQSNLPRNNLLPWDEELKDLNTAYVNLILSSYDHPQPPYTDEEAQEVKLMDQQILDEISTKYDRQTIINVLDDKPDVPVDNKTAAGIKIDYFQKLIDLGQDKAALIYRVNQGHQY